MKCRKLICSIVYEVQKSVLNACFETFERMLKMSHKVSPTKYTSTSLKISQVVAFRKRNIAHCNVFL
jgi:hypothetical protein